MTAKTGAGARNKGADGERELARLIRDVYGYDVRRGQVFNHQSDIVGLPGVHFEVKRQERLNIWAALEQAENEAQKRRDGEPCVFFRRNRGKWHVAVPLELFMDMYGAWKE